MARPGGGVPICIIVLSVTGNIGIDRWSSRLRARVNYSTWKSKIKKEKRNNKI
ncbi:hypothetical protein BDV36DRAFT_276543 [Aspergillus pseudocaelatus]|uniref:Uncharacterized protein n=1 Tax=Aspergillus pseudocaelatus TaxID=1825620 RepID=A0ABQ6W164_9EURO|nr:hypothetical protein BDV36DRAFT_276543 [Aspergillus pseudocaelatus]